MELCGRRKLHFPRGHIIAYTDGVTESFNGAGEDFGEERLIEALRRHRATAPEDLIASIANDVQGFGQSEQYDDITLTVARCRKN
jgi:sigma-B regulation protein RsbU (phosphoserine phosphatase)